MYKGWYAVKPKHPTNQSIKYQSFVCSQLNGFKYCYLVSNSIYQEFQPNRILIIY